MFWQTLIRLIGGIYSIGSYTVCIYDNGIFYSKDMIIQWDWKITK